MCLHHQKINHSYLEAPQNIHADEVTNNYIVIAWSPSKTENVTYAVEKYCSPRNAWKSVGSTNIAKLKVCILYS